jgi:hypothetical protein
MQLQRDGALNGYQIAQLRLECDLSAVIVNWDGDQHYEPDDPARRWFRILGMECDMSLVANTAHPARYATLGVRHPGYLPVGYDPDVYCPRAWRGNVADVVFLGNHYPHLDAYLPRAALVHLLAATLGDRFSVYGHGWELRQARPAVFHGEAAEVYASSRAAIAISSHSLPRCTSDRLFYAMASGALVCVEHFPDMAALGLLHGVNCLVWHEPGELLEQLRNFTDWDEAPLAAWSDMRGAAAEMARTLHTWHVRIGELMAMVDAVREARRR